MSEPNTAKPSGEPDVHEHAVDFNNYLRRCVYVFVAVVCAVSLMLVASYLPHFDWPAKVAMILAVACTNALVVAGFLMHLISEKKMIYTLLAFTAFFFAGLIGLTVWAMQDFPAGTVTH
jgi:heme/copper-type cytochrome/quinol oxidase subunit 4